MTTRPDTAVLAARNPEVQTLRRLSRRRSARTEAGRYVIDGPRLVLEALDAGVVVDCVYLPVDATGVEVGQLRRRGEAGDVDVRLLAAGVLGQVASTQAPQPAIAIARPRLCTVADALDGVAHPLVLVLCDVADPGNAGTLLRVAEAAGAALVLVCGPAAVEVHNPKVVRAAAGSLFRVPVVTMATRTDALDALGARGLRRVATVVDGGQPYDGTDLRGAVALVLGSEAHGLPPEVIARVDERVRIPMAGRVESLNVGVAGAVLAFEAARQRRVQR